MKIFVYGPVEGKDGPFAWVNAEDDATARRMAADFNRDRPWMDPRATRCWAVREERRSESRRGDSVRIFASVADLPKMPTGFVHQLRDWEHPVQSSNGRRWQPKAAVEQA